LADWSIRLPKLFKEGRVVAFDNLAIKQLGVARHLTKEEYSQFYMGEDGKFTMYLDMVKREFAVSSTTVERHKFENKNVIEMFQSL